MKGSFLGWFVVLFMPVKEIFCSALAVLVGPVQNIFFLTVHYFNSLTPSPAGWAGSHTGSPVVSLFKTQHCQKYGNQLENYVI